MFDSVDFLTGLLYGSMWTFLCILSRFGPLLVLMPPLQGASVPNRVKVMVVLMVSFAMTPIVMEYSTPLPGNLADIILGLVKELLLGLLFGSSALIIVTSLQKIGRAHV